ncbi:helix-turn-helix domain-containing protein [Halobaculum lipolyticum]|uniref:Helix-turn-helix domain-containing protein n=1 Tax=Halobaculum lipolyticum TaxID=3032001 RepID=A0ABD5WJ37_9EURY|nr:helix-turn-helix domain-containing protein [Halobaculum sp. DT31]
MLIAQYTIDHPFLRRTLRTVSGLDLEWEDSYTDEDGRMRLTGWLHGVTPDVLDPAIDADPTVAARSLLTESRGRLLYRLDFADDYRSVSTRTVIAEVGGVNERITADDDGWHFTTRFPDRTALEHVYDFCRRADIAFELDRIYQHSGLYTADEGSLTAVQRETLVAAVETGYLDVPRGASLADLGERLGVSESATSERFRRGVKRLVSETLVE